MPEWYVAEHGIMLLTKAAYMSYWQLFILSVAILCLGATATVSASVAMIDSPPQEEQSPGSQVSPERSRPGRYVLPAISTLSDLEETHDKDHKLLIVLVVNSREEPNPSAAMAWDDPRVRAELDTQFQVGLIARDELRVKSDMNSRVFKVLDEQYPCSNFPNGVFVIRSWKVVDQDIGFDSAEEILAWLHILRSETGITAAFAETRAHSNGDSLGIRTSLVFADRLRKLSQGKRAAIVLVAAMEQYFAKSDLHPDEDPTGRRFGSNLPGDEFLSVSRCGFPERTAWQALTIAPELAATLSKLRDERIEQAIAPMPSPAEPSELRLRWAVIGQALKLVGCVPDAAAASRLDSGVRNLESLGAHKRLMFFFERDQLNSVLYAIHCGEWKMAGNLIVDPEVMTRQTISFAGLSGAFLKITDAPQTEQKAAHLKVNEMVAVLGGQIYAALLAADRDDDAARALTEMLNGRSIADLRELLLAVCLKARQARPQHLEWAIEADAARLARGAEPEHYAEKLKVLLAEQSGR